MSSINRFSLILISFASLCPGADTPLWEPGKVVAVEEVYTPAKEPDPSCRAVPKGATPPAKCRPSNLRAEQFWRVTVDVGNKRMVVRPYRASNVLEALNQAATDYVDPHVTAGSAVEVALTSNKAIRLRADLGQGMLAMVDSQQLLSNPVAPAKREAKAELSPPPPVTSGTASDSKVVLLENGDFVALETLEFKPQDIGDGASLYSFSGDSSTIRAGSKTPVFLVLAESEAAAGGSPELSRLQVSKRTRQMVYSAAKKRSASSVAIVVTQVSATVRKFSVKEPLSPGEYVVLLENANRGFLFEVR